MHAELNPVRTQGSRQARASVALARPRRPVRGGRLLLSKVAPRSASALANGITKPFLEEVWSLTPWRAAQEGLSRAVLDRIRQPGCEMAERRCRWNGRLAGAKIAGGNSMGKPMLQLSSPTLDGGENTWLKAIRCQVLGLTAAGRECHHAACGCIEPSPPSRVNLPRFQHVRECSSKPDLGLAGVTPIQSLIPAVLLSTHSGTTDPIFGM